MRVKAIYNLLTGSGNQNEQMRKDEMGEIHSTHGIDERCLRMFCWET
jgi:hypothetical protein